MKRKIKFSLAVISLVSSILLLTGGSSQAVWQANPTTHASPVTNTGSGWGLGIRQMEETGQTMGLTEIVDKSTLEPTTPENNIDVHMELPTEYGAIAILSASGYGNPGMLQDEEDVLKRTTTGNSTGVYFTGSRLEELAATSSGFGVCKYNLGSAVGTGDIRTFTNAWHGATGINQDIWSSSNNSTAWFAREELVIFLVSSCGNFGGVDHQL